MSKFIQRGYFILYFSFKQEVVCRFRKLKYTLLGMEVGSNTYLSKIYTTFPNQVSIGSNCILEDDLFFKYDGIWKKGKSIILQDFVFIGKGCEFNISHKLIIGKNSNIASGCKFIDHDHGTKAGMLIGPQTPVVGEIILGEDVWLGCNVIVL